MNRYKIYYPTNPRSKQPARVKAIFKDLPQCQAVIVMDRKAQSYDCPVMPYYSALIWSGNTQKAIRYDRWLNMDVQRERMERDIETINQTEQLAQDVLNMLLDMPDYYKANGEHVSFAERWDVVPAETLENDRFSIDYHFSQPVQVALHDREDCFFKSHGRWQTSKPTIYAHSVNEVWKIVSAVMKEELPEVAA